MDQRQEKPVETNHSQQEPVEVLQRQEEPVETDKSQQEPVEVE